MKKMMVLLFAIALLFAVQVEARIGVSIPVQGEGVLHVRGFLDDTTGRTGMVFVKNGDDPILEFGQITPETKIMVREKNQQIGDLQKLENKPVFAYGRQSDGILSCLIVFPLSGDVSEDEILDVGFLEIGQFLSEKGEFISEMLHLRVPAPNFESKRMIKKTIFCGLVNEFTKVTINHIAAMPKDIRSFNGEICMQYVHCISKFEGKSKVLKRIDIIVDR